MSENKKVNRLFLIVVAVYVGVSIGLSVASVFVPALAQMPVYVSILLSQSLVFVPCFIYCKRKGMPISEWIPYRKINFATIVLVVVCTYLMYPLIIVVNAVSMLFTNSGTTAVLEMMQGQNLILSVLFMAVMPACVEEFMFRGILFQTYKKSRLLPAVFLSAFLFGCLHLNLNQFMYAFVLGVYLSFLVEATGSIFSSMVAHFTLNVTSVIMSFALPYLYEMTGTSQEGAIQSGGLASAMEGYELFMFVMGIAVWFVIAIGTTCGAVGVYIAISKINKRWDYVKQMFRGGTRERMITIPLVIGILIAFAVMGMKIYIERAI